MSIANPKLRYSGFQALTGGVDSGRSPYLLDPSTLAWAVNATMRGNTITSRPGWRRRTTLDASGRWQGAGTYEADSGALSLVASVGGRLYQTDIDSYATLELTSTDTNSATAPQAWFCQAESYLVIQNGEDDAFVFDGGALTRSYGQSKVGAALAGVPVGKQMAYNNGRLWVARPNGYSFVGGDLVWSHDPPSRKDVLSFTENTFLNGGGEFGVPMSAGKITALASIAVIDSATGQGPLQVFTERGGFSVNAPFNRDDWASVSSPIATVSLMAPGATAQNAAVNVNGDIWFRSSDGVRSFAVAHRDFGTWVNTPISTEMARLFNHDNTDMLGYASATLFDNRLLVTAAPKIVSVSNAVRAITHRGLGVLDFNPVSGMFNRAQPVWEGLWTGLSILQVLTHGDRCFIYALSSDDVIELWELTRTERFDSGDNAISWAFETPAYGFDTGGWSRRELQWGDLWMNRINGTVSYTVRFRPDADQVWTEWIAGRAVCALTEDCAPASCTAPANYVEQYRARVRLPYPPTTCDTSVDKPRHHGYRFSARVELSGACSIPQFRLAANDMSEETVGACPDASCTETGVTDNCVVDDFAYTTQT